MPTPTFVANAFKLLKSNSPEILTGLGIVGVLTTSYLSAKASFEASEMIHVDILEQKAEHPGEPHIRTFKDNFKLVWKRYIPAGISGAFTIGCIAGASRAGNRRTAAAVTAYSLSQRAFDEYREKVVKELGKGKDRKVREEVVQDRVRENPPVSSEVIITGKGHILCHEGFTGRYFRSDKETLDRALNDINWRINHNLFVYLDEFYDLIGLPSTTSSTHLGWDSDKLLVLQYMPTLAENEEPCLSFDYNYTKPL